jgi:phosphatidylinositol alpha-1,6-mannosyltransferase
MIGLFPWLGPGSVGGVQVSGQLAWEGLAPAIEGRGAGSFRLCYGAAPGARAGDAATLLAASRGEAIRAALGRRWDAATVLVWHVDLLKLLPFMRGMGTLNVGRLNVERSNVQTFQRANVPCRRPRVVLFLHGIEIWRRPSRLTHLLLRRVDLFLCNSRHTWERACDFVPSIASRPHQIVNLGIGDALHAPPPAPSEPPAALVLGRLARGEDYKGHRELIAAWPGVRERIPGAELWIAGDGDLRADLERAAQEQGASGIHFLGQVSDERKHDLLARCRCLAMPSRGEGFGLVYLEAMRLGRPCLVSTHDAGREVVAPPEAGLAADPGDQHALVSAICRLLAPGPEWERWSGGARRRYEERFTARHFQERLAAALWCS